MEKSSPRRAAEYMRMSTEHQQYSIANQSAAIQEYATSHSMEIVRTFADRGKSGLGVTGRHALLELLRVVQSGSADFSVLLVYDVSRWGRFQDVDESAFYEHSLKRAGVRIVYCAETFQDSGSPLDSLLKTLKRTMAAEYSRELSVKVSAGQRRIAALGFRLGGSAGFGFRRMILDAAGSQRGKVEAGDHKAVNTDRVTLVHGPADEVRAVRQVFDLFVYHSMSEARIATYLNERSITTRLGNPWTKKTIRDMLTNPKYAGDMVFARTAAKMRSVPVRTLPGDWICVADSFEPIVSRDIWKRAQEIYQERVEDLKEDVMLAQLRSLLSKRGRLSSQLIDSEEGMVKAQTYQKRFGSLTEAYRRIGWDGERRYRSYALRPQLRIRQAQLEEDITTGVAQSADFFRKDEKVPLWTVNGDFTIYAAVVVINSSKDGKRSRTWTLHRTKAESDLMVIARSNETLTAIRDYFVVPSGHATPITLFEDNPWSIDIHRFADLSFLKMLCSRVELQPET
jgi:DNA invertase Pin-like site-specific DNA recombinase